MKPTSSPSRYLVRSLMFLAAVPCFLPLQVAYGQSLGTCDAVVVDSANDVWQTICIEESSSTDPPQIQAYVETDTSNGAYVPAVDAEAILSSSNTQSNAQTFLGQADYDNFCDSCAYPISSGPELNDDVYTGITVAMEPNTLYEVSAGYGECYDSTGNYGYNSTVDEWGYCNWSNYDYNPDFNIGTNTFNPALQVVSILYAPPGDKSTTGYTNSTTNGTITSVGSSFTQSNGVTFSGNAKLSTAFGGGSVGGSIGYSVSTTNGNSNYFQTTLSNQSGMTALAITLTDYNPSYLDMPTRLWDTFAIEVNPQITTASDQSGNILGYSVDAAPVSGDGWTTYAAISEPVAEDMINGTVATAALEPTHLPVLPNQPQYYLPGLASVCKNLIQSEYDSGTCSLSDQCGCQSSDYSPALSRDALLGWNSQTLTASPTPAYESPVVADTSGSSCLSPTSSLSCQYVPVPQSSTDANPQLVTLSYTAGNSFTQTDSTSTTTTFSEARSYTVAEMESYGWQVSFLNLGTVTFGLTNTNSWTWTDSESQGAISSIQNQMNINLETGNTGCVEDNYVYEDTIYHTFVVQPPQNASGCKQ
ncbi:MAG: hypothetical protein ACRD19_03825 [Terriglobia bacterium]